MVAQIREHHPRCPAALRRLLPCPTARNRAAPPCRAAPPSRASPPSRATLRCSVELRCPFACTASAATTATAATASTAATPAMASPTVLTFDAEGRAVDFDVWVDDLQLFLQCDSRDGVSLFDHTSGVSTAPAATADSTVCSQWTTHDAVARLALRSHLPPAERAHFGQYKTAKSLYDAVVVRYSSPATAALIRLMLPYLFPDLAAFATVAELITHLYTSHARYRAALPTEFCAKTPPPPMYITLYYLVTRLPNSLASVRDHFLSLCPTELTVDLLEERLPAAEKSILAVGAASAPSGRRRNSKGKGSKGGGGDGGGGGEGGGGGGAGGGGGGGGAGSGGFSGGMGGGGGSGGGGGGSGSGAGGSGSGGGGGGGGGAGRGAATQRGGFGGDCYLSVPPDPGIEAAALGASASVAPGAGESALSGTAPTEALHTFTLDSGASRSFFRDSTTLTPLSRPIAISVADPFGGPVLVHSSTVLPCPAAPSGLLSGLHLPSFSTNLVSGADLQDVWIAASGQVFAAASRSSPESAPCSCRPLLHETLLWHHRLGHPSLPRLQGMASRTLVSGLPRSLPPLPVGPAPTCVPCVEGRQRAAPHSSEFPPTEAPLQTLHMDVWGPARVRGQGHERYFLLVVDDYSRYTTVFPLRSKGAVTEGICQKFTLPASPQQNGIDERRIGMVMDVARTSMIHATAPHFLWLFAVQYAAHQINLQPRVSLPETTPTLRWTGKVGDASAFRVWGSLGFVRNTSADKLSSCAGPAPSGVSQVDPAEPVEVAVDSYAARGAEPGVSVSEGAEPGGAEPEHVEPGGAEPGGAESRSAEPGGVEPERAESGGPPGVPSWREPLSLHQLGEWYALCCRRAAGAGASGGAAGGAGAAGAASAAGVAGAGGAAGAAGGAAGTRAAGGGSGGARGAAGAGVAGGATRVTSAVGGPAGVGAAGGAGAAGPGGARTGGTGAAGAGGAAGVGAAGAGAVATGGASGAGATGGTGAGGAAGDVAGDSGAEGTGAVSAVSEGAARPRPYYVLLLQRPTFPLSGPSPYSGPTRGLTERREPESRPVSPESLPASPESRSALPVRTVCAGRRVSRPRPPPVPGTHSMTLRPSTAPQRVPLPSPPASSLPDGPDPESDSLRVASPTVTRFLATAVTDPLFESTAVSALVAELVDFAAACRLDYATSPVAESASASVCPPSVGGECALGRDVLEDRQEESECFAAAVPHLWQAAMDAEMASWKSTGTYVDEFPQLGANIVSGMWIFRVKRPLGSPLVFKARYVARGFSQREGVDFFQTFSPTPKMTTLRVLLHVAAQRDYELHSLDFNTAVLQGSLHEEIWLRRPPNFTRSVLLDRAQRTITLTLSHMVQQELQRFDFTYSSPQSTPLPTGHSLSAPPSDESVEPSGPYPELVGCLMYLMTCTQPGLAYPLSLLARYVAMAAQELRWLTYLLTDLGESPRSPPVLYVDNKAMLALCQEHRLEHRTKHIALRYFFARDLQ
ncbi:unnamed protein product [Closterium sp. NIES-54]